jgi:N-methylhydantoinase B
MATIQANSRTPASLRGDLGAQIAACKTGTIRYGELFERWPRVTIDAAAESLMTYAERITRQEIGAIADGEYRFTDYLDNDGLSQDSQSVAIAVTVTVSGSDITFDFAGTASQVRSAINNVPASTRAIVYYAVRLLTGDRVPNNDGCYRPITVRLPEGSVVNSTYPAPVASRGVSLQRIEDVILGAMARALPQRMTAAHSGQYTLIGVAGPDPDGDGQLIGHLGGPFSGGHGARPTKDGIDVSSHGAANGSAIPVEIAEARLPMRFRRLELWPDSGGAGRWRGGLGYQAEVEWLRGETMVTLRRERTRFGPWGIEGGGGAPPSRAEVVRQDATTAPLPGKIELPFWAGERLRYWTTGSGGYGDPQEREVSRVHEDVLDGRVSAAAAAAAYGVVIKDESVDVPATDALRARRSADTGSVVQRRHGE